MKLRISGKLLGIALWLLCVLATAKDRGLAASDRVLLVRNGESPISKTIAEDYAHRRGVRWILTVSCPDAAADAKAETLDFASYQHSIEAPLRAYLAAHPQIDFIVLTKGIPIRLVTPGPGITRYSLDSRLAALDYEQQRGAVRVEISDPNYGVDFHGRAWANRYWASTQQFSHRKFGGYLVTRLDGYTVSDAIALTTHALEAEHLAQAHSQPAGPILLDAVPHYGLVAAQSQPHNAFIRTLTPSGVVEILHESAFAGLNGDMQLAASLLTAHRIPVELDTSDAFVGARVPLMGYLSWGSNDPKFSDETYHALRFGPGAIGDTAVSSSGRTFLTVHDGGQSLAADLIAQGITGIKAYSDEPLLQAVASPSILFARYSRGWTLAESFYAASAMVGWEDLVIGDPLARAYPRP